MVDDVIEPPDGYERTPAGRLVPKIPPVPVRHSDERSTSRPPIPPHSPARKDFHYTDIDTRILYAIKVGIASGMHGLTVDEISLRLDLDTRVVAPRVTKLEHEAKAIVESGHMRKTSLGGQARVMMLASAEPELDL